MTSTSVSESTLKPASPTPKRRALRATCRVDSSPETIKHPSPRYPITCKSSVLFPTPGSPPTSTIEPGTMPPPRTRFSSPTPVPILPPSRSARTSRKAIVAPAAFFGAFVFSARAAKPTAFLSSCTSSTKVLHSPQSGQRPSHFGSVCPQLEHTNFVLVAIRLLYETEGKAHRTRSVRPQGAYSVPRSHGKLY